MDWITAQLEESGYAVIPNVVGIDGISNIERFIDDGNGVASTRRLINRAWCRQLADRLSRDTRLSGALPANARPVQCTLFVKFAELHQHPNLPDYGPQPSQQDVNYANANGIVVIVGPGSGRTYYAGPGSGSVNGGNVPRGPICTSANNGLVESEAVDSFNICDSEDV